MSTKIVIKDLVKAYAGSAKGDATRAVDSVSLTIEAGELFFLLGPSGCGKTTLLRMIAGFIEPTSGNILFTVANSVRDVTYLPAEKRDTGMVFQSYALWPHMTVAENVEFGLMVRGTPQNERSTLVQEALEIVQMSAYGTRKPTQLSGGQQQRVALARAIVVKPSVLLLDEPLSNLDARLRVELRTEVRRVCKASGITTVYVTHDQSEALSMADRIAIMKSGKIRQVGTPSELYSSPRGQFEAQFLGEVSFFQGNVSHATGDVLDVTALGSSIQARSGLPKNQVSGRCIVATRPESWILGRSKQNQFEARVVDRMYLGDTLQVTLDIHGSRVGLTVLNPGRNFDLPSTCAVSIDTNDVIILPAD